MLAWWRNICENKYVSKSVLGDVTKGTDTLARSKGGGGVACNYVKVSRDNFPCYLIVKGSVSQNYVKCFIFWNDKWKRIKTRQRHWTRLPFQVFPTDTDAMHFKIPLTLHILILMSSTVLDKFRITPCLKPSLKCTFIKLCKQAIVPWLCLISLTLICYHEITWKLSSKMWNFSHNYAILKTFFFLQYSSTKLQEILSSFRYAK